MTEKRYAPTKTEKKVSNKAVSETPVQTQNIKQDNKKSAEDKKTEEIKPETKANDKKEDKKSKQPSKKVKKEEVVVNARSVPVSTKYAISICKFIKKKRIGDAIRDLEKVVILKKAVPMKGEIPHRKGKIMSGRFPQRAAKEFIVILKSLAGNATNHDIDEPVISEAIANKAQKPFGRFGRWQRKRTHITLKAREMKEKQYKRLKGKK